MSVQCGLTVTYLSSFIPSIVSEDCLLQYVSIKYEHKLLLCMSFQNTVLCTTFYNSSWNVGRLELMIKFINQKIHSEIFLKIK